MWCSALQRWAQVNRVLLVFALVASIGGCGRGTVQPSVTVEFNLPESRRTELVQFMTEFANSVNLPVADASSRLPSISPTDLLVVAGSSVRDVQIVLLIDPSSQKYVAFLYASADADRSRRIETYFVSAAKAKFQDLVTVK